MFAVYKREIRAMLYNLHAGVFVTALLLTAGITVFLFNFLVGAADLIYAMPEMAYALLVAVPFLCATAFSNDRRGGMDTLYASLPVSAGGVVLGKYLARLTLMAVPTLVIGLYPLVLGLYGTSNLPGAYATLLVFFLLGAALMALCLFIASFSRRAWLNGLVSLAVAVLLYGVPHALAHLPDAASGVANVLTYLSPFYHYDALLNWHTLDAGAVLYLLSFAAVFLLLTTLKVKGGRVRTATLMRGVALTAACTCLLAVANVALTALPGRKADISSMGASRVSTETAAFLQSMKRDATIWWLCDGGEPINVIDMLIDHYRTDRVTIRVLDINDTSDPDVARLLSAHGELAEGSMVVECEATGRARAIPFGDLYYYVNDYYNSVYAAYIQAGVTDGRLSMEQLEQFRQQILQQEGADLSENSTTLTYFNGEAMLTGALDYVTTDGIPYVYELLGHGDGLEDEVVDLLASIAPGAMTGIPLDLSAVEAVPDNAAAIIICDPTSDLSDSETVMLAEFLQRGGALLLSAGAESRQYENLMSLCEFFGVSAAEGTLSDPDSRDILESTDGLPANTVVPIGNTQSTVCVAVQEVLETAFLLMSDPYAIEILSKEELEAIKAGVYTMLSTTDTAVQVMPNGDNIKVDEDANGFPVAVEASREVDGAVARLVWFADDGIFTMEQAKNTGSGNLLYLAASLETVVSPYHSVYEDMEGVNMSVTAMSKMTAGAATLWGIVIIAVIPLGTLTAAIAVYRKRRRAA